MRVGVNCLNLDPLFVGGLTTFARGLLDGIANVNERHNVRLYATTYNRRLFDSLQNRKNVQLVELDDRTISRNKNFCRASLLSFSERVYASTSNVVFREIRRLMDEDNDIIYTPSVVLQSFDNKKPTVLSMHDLQHVHYPNFFNWPRRLSRKITYGLSAQHADFFQASSEFIKADLLTHFRCVSPEQIAVIPEGVRVEDFAEPVDTAYLGARFGIPERFIFFPAQLWPHKNHLTLLRALKHLEATRGVQIPLVLTGGEYTAASQIFSYLNAQSMSYVHYLGTVDFRDIVALHQKAEFLVMPSLHESNSLPILEAAAANTQVLASRIPPNEELGRTLQLNFFDPLNEQELANLILRCWEDEMTRAGQIAHNRKHIGRYSWESSARQYLQLFESIVRVDQT